MIKKGFEGWYFKHQKDDDMLALIPGTADSGAFMQVMTPQGSRQISLPALYHDDGVLHAEGIRFTREGCSLALPGLTGEIRYGPLQPLKSPVMGLFRFFPMECSHEVISMGHALHGSIAVGGRCIDFTDGVGYMEKDSGRSFPSAYQWMQCNDFPGGSSIMVSIARVPFCGVKFRGCICVLLHRGREYRLATYRGVRILSAGAAHIRLAQGALLLDIDMQPSCDGHNLFAPLGGVMRGIIRESSNAAVRIRLWEHGTPVCDLRSVHAAYEFVPAIAGAKAPS